MSKVEPIYCPLCKHGVMTEKSGRFSSFYSCNNYPKCPSACKSINGEPDLASLLVKNKIALFTLNDQDVKNALYKIVFHAYPGYKIPEFTLKIHSKESRSYHGNWSYPRPNKISHINILNLSRKHEHTLATIIHELAHHCHFMIAGETNHKKEFYAVLKHLLEVAHNLGFINILEIKDELDSNDVEKLNEHFGDFEIYFNNKVSLDVIKLNYQAQDNQLIERGYIYSTKEQKWVCSISSDKTIAETDWLEKEYIDVEYEITDNRWNRVEAIYYCIVGNLHKVHPDTLIAHGFFRDTVNGWVNKIKATDLGRMNQLCSRLHLKPFYKGFLPTKNKKANSIKYIPELGKKCNKFCPKCGSLMEFNDGASGIFYSCSNFVLGCRHMERG